MGKLKPTQGLCDVPVIASDKLGIDLPLAMRYALAMTAQQYSSAAKFLHWAIALALAFQLGLGWQLEHIPKGPLLFTAYQMHKSVGISILLLTIARIAIRIIHRPPPLMADSPWALLAAKIVHWALYAIMLIGPLTGWILVSTARIKVPTLLFGMVPWPHLPVPQSWHEPTEEVHELVAKLLLGLFFLHFLGALRHQFVKDENILGRMLPFVSLAPVSKAKAGLLAFLALFIMWAAHGAGWQYPFSRPKAAAAVETPAPQGGAPVAPVTTNGTATPEQESQAADEAKAEEEVSQPLADWSVSPGGKLGFAASWAGQPINGSFGRWNAAIRFSPDEVEKTAIRVTIDLATANTADSQRDESLKGSDFFNVSAHPKAVFTASGAKALGHDRYQSSGTLDLHGVKKPLTLAYTVKIKKDVAQVSGTTSLDRTAFGVGSGEWSATDQIAAKVGVSFSFNAKRKAAN